MDDDVKVLERIYDRFNARDLDGVLAALTDESPGPTEWMAVTSMAARPYANTGRANGAWSVLASSLWVFIELRMARSSQRSGSPSTISKANRSRTRRTGLGTKRSGTFFGFEMARWLASISRISPGSADSTWITGGSRFDTNLHLIASSISLACCAAVIC